MLCQNYRGYPHFLAYLLADSALDAGRSVRTQPFAVFIHIICGKFVQQNLIICSTMIVHYYGQISPLLLKDFSRNCCCAQRRLTIKIKLKTPNHQILFLNLGTGWAQNGHRPKISAKCVIRANTHSKMNNIRKF